MKNQASFVSPGVDFALAGGLSLVAYGLLSSPLGEQLAPRVAQALILYLVWAGNAPHFAATHYRLYRSRRTIARFPFTALAVPVFVAAMVALSLGYPQRIAPYFVKLYLWWSPYHYSGQAAGLCLLYARRAGFRASVDLRRALIALLYGIFVASALRAESGNAPISYFGIPYPVFGVAPALIAPLFVGLGVIALHLLWLVAREARAQGRWPSWLCAVPLLAHWVWFIPGPSATTFFQMVPFFHGIQYLLVAGTLHRQEHGRGQTVLWLVLNVLGGIALMGALPKAIASAIGGDALVVMPIVIAGVQVHHFFVDGVIWKLRDPALAALAGSTRAATVRSREAA